MKTTVNIQNLKCNGCATTITNKLTHIENVTNVSVDVENSNVAFEYDTDEKLVVVKEALRKAGYPEEGDSNTIGTQAKSYVSCAIGKMS